MAEIDYNTMFDQLTDLEKQQYEGVMGMGGFKSNYEKNPDSPLVTQNPNYGKFKSIADAQSQVPEKGIFSSLNPFSSASASEITPREYGLQINNPSIFDINQVGDPALNPGSVNAIGINPYGVNENLIDRGNPFNDSRVASEEMGLVGDIPDRGRGMPGTMGAYEMIGGTPVAVGDVLGMQQALEKSNLTNEPTKENLGILGLIGSLIGPKSLRGLTLGLRASKMGNAMSSMSRGIGSLGSKFAGKMRGINPITGRPNTQSQYEQARADRQTQNRVNNVANRIANNKKTLSNPYSIAKTKEQKDQISDAINKGAKTDHSAGYTGMGSCFIAGTKVTMADSTFKNIEDVKVGDKVKGHKGNNEVIKLDPTLLGDRKLYSFNDNEHYFFTSEHPFMTEEGWKSIKPEKTKERDGVELYEQLKGELKVGDKLVTDNGSIEITDIKSKEINSPEMPLYNFNISNDNSYIADDYVVHNKGGSGGCVIATHAVNSGAFTKDTKREAVRWCVKNLHRTWWGEAVRKGYKYYGQKAIEEGNAKNHYQEFKDYVAFGTGKRRTLKTGWTFVYRTVQFFLRGLTL